MDEESGFIYFEAKPKFRRYDDVYQTITDLTVLCQELYEGIADFRISLNLASRRKLTFQVIFDDFKDKEAFEQNRRFQELLIDLRLACKPDRLLRYKRLVATRYRYPNPLVKK